MQNMNYNYNYTDFHIDDFLIKNEQLDSSSLMSNSPSPQEFSFEDNHSERSYNLTAITTSLSSDSFEETSLTEEKETKNKTKKKKKPVVKKRVLKKKKAPSSSQKKVLTDVPIEIIKGNKVYFHPRNLLSIDPNSTAAKNILKETKKKVRNSDFDILEFTSATRSVDDILELLWEAINGIYIPMSSCNELFISQEHMDEVFQMMVKRAHQPKVPETQNVIRFNWNHYKEKLSDPQAKSKISNRRKERRRKRERIQQVADNTTKKRVLKSKSEITNNDIDKMTAQFEEEIKFSCDSQNDPFDQNDLVDHQYDDGFFSIFEEEPQINFYEIEEKNTTPYSNKQVVPKMIDFAPRFGVVHNPNYLHITGEYLSSTSLVPLYYVFPHNAPTSSTSPLTGTTLSIENQRMFVSLPSFSEPCSLWIFLQVPFTTTVTTCPNPIYHVLSNAEYSMKKKPNGPTGGNDQGGDGGFNFNDSNMGGGSGFGGGNNNFFNGGNNSFGGGNNSFNSGNNGGNNGGFGGFQFNDFQPTTWKEGNIWHLACGSGNLSMINFLHQKRIPHIDSRDENGKTPLMWAIHNSHLHVVKLLFKLGAKFNLADNDGNTALHLAVSKNEVAIVEYMLHCGSVDVNNVNKEDESALDFALALDIVPMIKVLLSHPSTLARNSITYWFPDCPNFKKWWYNTKDLQELVNLSNNDLVKKTMITRIELEQYNSELKKELSEKKVDFEEFSKRSQNEIQKLGRSYKENKEKMNQTQDKLLQSKKALRDLKEEKNKLTNKVNELIEYNEIKDNEISRLKEALEKAQRELLEAKSSQTAVPSTESRPKRTKKKMNLLESSKSIQRYNPKKILKKSQSSKSLSKSESNKTQFNFDMNQLGVFNFKQIYSTIIEQVGKYTPLSYPLNFNQMDDDDIINHVVESDQQSLKTILSEIVNAIQDGGIKNPNELSNAVKIAVQMRYITN